MAVKILSVDDEMDLELLLTQYFRRKIRKGEYEFVFAHNGLEALTMMLKHPDIEIILSDINMPEMDGLTLLAKINEMRNPALKVIMVSAYGDMGNIRQAMNNGAFDFATKPIDLDDLSITIEKAIEQIQYVHSMQAEHQQLESLKTDLAVASEIQQAILPRVFPPFEDLTQQIDIAASMVPAKDVGGDFYDAIKAGTVSMDDFMDTIVKLNDKGVGKFASFAEQAKASTDGIQTSITNVKTAITRGLANSIDALNKSLKKSNLPSINDMIQNFGRSISKAFNKVNEAMGKIKWNKITPVLKEVIQYFKGLKNTMFSFIKDVFKKIDWNMVLKIAPTILKIVGTFKLLNPLIKTGASAIGSLSNVIKGLTNPIGLAITVISGLATAITFLTNNQSEEQRHMKEFREEIENSTKEMNEFNASVDENMRKSVAHIDHTKALSDELRTLVDENGKVKEGYEGRVKFILNELNSALGTEYKLNNHIIENYQDMQKEIDELIRKKRAEIIINSEQEKYKKALEKRTEAYEKMNEIVKKTGMSIEDMRKKMERLRSGDVRSEEEISWVVNYGMAFEELEKQIQTSTDNIKQYESDYALFTQNKYDEIGTSIKTSTKDWTDETTEQMNKYLVEKENNLRANLELFKTYNEEKHKNDVNNGLKDLALLRSQLEDRTKTVTRLSQPEIEAFIRLAQSDRSAFNSILGQTSGDTKKQLETIAGVIDQNGSIPEKEIKEVADYMTYQFTSMNGRKWGDDMVQGIINGIRDKQAAARQVANQLASIIASPLHFSRPDEGPLRYYEKWMPDFVQGLKKTLELATPNLYGAINKMASNMKDQLSVGFGMSPTLNNVSSYNPSVNVTIHNNMETDFMGNLVSNIKTFSNGSKNDYNYGMS